MTYKYLFSSIFRTTVPIQLGKTGNKETATDKRGKRKDGREDSVTSDLPTSPG